MTEKSDIGARRCSGDRDRQLYRLRPRRLKPRSKVRSLFAESWFASGTSGRQLDVRAGPARYRAAGKGRRRRNAHGPRRCQRLPVLSASSDSDGQLIVNSSGSCNGIAEDRLGHGRHLSAATVRSASPIAQQNVSGLATGSYHKPGQTVYIAAFAYSGNALRVDAALSD